VLLVPQFEHSELLATLEDGESTWLWIGVVDVDGVVVTIMWLCGARPTRVHGGCTTDWLLVSCEIEGSLDFIKLVL